MTSDAFENNPSGEMHNDAYLGYSNNPYDNKSYTEDKDSKTVYTYAINLTKVDTNGNRITTGIAKFELKNSNNETLYFTRSDDTYNFSNTPTTSGATKDLTTSLTGTLKLQGLDAGTYTLTETERRTVMSFRTARLRLRLRMRQIMVRMERLILLRLGTLQHQAARGSTLRKTQRTMESRSTAQRFPSM